ncbi:hypothetical protein F2P81_023192 [Scophthalmus maximus]|uniref:thiopurine S-methyltransferase n=1 Tax=Scophthalmus maximus TaxID=52904 RepID=A0A6A4RYI3_SCOMX|nr:hypothetical protein F2P81_023192 [Scophthalmus maximus]
MLALQAERVMTLGEWEERWHDDRIGFHQPDVHKLLENNIEKVLAGRAEVSFFFPLCGKAVDMKWLADMGHSVVGVEISEKAIKQFFEESNLTYSEEPVAAIPGAKVYKSSEKNITLYQCDLYNFSSSIHGPPFLVPDEQVHSLFGSSCNIELLQSVDALTDRYRGWGLDSLTENVHLVTLKA